MCYVFLCIPYWQFDNCMECKEVCCAGAPLSSHTVSLQPPQAMKSADEAGQVIDGRTNGNGMPL